MLTKTSSRALIIVPALLIAVALVAGCKKGSKEAPKTQAVSAPADMPGAKKIYDQRCAVCHGKTGLGDGIGAKGLKPKPRNYSDAKWQATVTDDQLKKTIIAGGAAVGKSPLMPGNPDLKGEAKEPVVNGLVKIIRSFKR